jgi:hypothetical protein
VRKAVLLAAKTTWFYLIGGRTVSEAGALVDVGSCSSVLVLVLELERVIMRPPDTSFKSELDNVVRFCAMVNLLAGFD